MVHANGTANGTPILILDTVNTQIDNAYIQLTSELTPEASTSWHITQNGTNAVQTRLSGITYTGEPRNVQEGNRGIVEGWGKYAGDPNIEGQWNGNGFDGAAVVDTTNSAKYAYRGGTWV